jgi:hypothetical protein
MGAGQNFNKKVCIFQIHVSARIAYRVSARGLFVNNFAWELLKASNLQAESKIIKKIIETPNLSIETKNF